jgi:hypothetical protein
MDGGQKVLPEHTSSVARTVAEALPKRSRHCHVDGCHRALPKHPEPVAWVVLKVVRLGEVPSSVA